ncbi:MAG: ATP-binding cassette domain-containing protein [Deltaproteobacteria bacterium]|nr:ATP-binding cassette domain-containing protein [Deltaproteobacteria bacterium]MBW2018503.1 ATP-binding cassette domain-containing protein [Deltaproteobacteria bacterium]MBW2073238.1 ATP-binding cassette domain-containing protein [Deltaproteobacteria bacterium]RLB83292.1 MAG: ABC transporter ATP-binding protein [Deltaproteobacteria bacterium]
MIEVDHLTKYFGPVPAVVDVSFRVEKGEIIGFLGPNGAGKTTTIRMLNGFFPPTSGYARINGLDVFDRSLDVRKRLGYLPENVPLYKEMRTEAYLRFVAEVKGVPARQHQREVDRVIEQCGLQAARKKFLGRLSKGFQQRVGIAQAILNDPDVLILDEPTIGLDPKQIIEIRELIKSFAGYKTVILSSHILPEVSMTCQRVVIINEGRIVAEDTPERLTGKDERRVVLEIKGPEAEVLARLRSVPGVATASAEAQPADHAGRYVVEMEQGKDVRDAIVQSIVSAGWSLLEMHMLRLSLEDVFIRLVTDEQGKG